MWSWKTDSAIWSSPRLDKSGLLFIGGIDTSLYALRADDGQLVPKYKTDEPVVGTPLITRKHAVPQAWSFQPVKCKMYYSKWFEPGGNMWKCRVIVRVSVVLRTTVIGGGDWRFHHLCGSHHYRWQSFAGLHLPGRSPYTFEKCIPYQTDNKMKERIR